MVRVGVAMRSTFRKTFLRSRCHALWRPTASSYARALLTEPARIMVAVVNPMLGFERYFWLFVHASETAMVSPSASACLHFARNC